MNCANTQEYQIRQGDSLYSIAQQFHTTVTSLLLSNPHANPYNLRVGDILTVCPGPGFTAPAAPPSANGGAISPAHFTLSNDMRAAWDNHIIWTRLAIVSILGDLRDTDAATKRLLKTADEISRIFGPFYGDAAAREIGRLLTGHIEIAGEMLTALHKGERERAKDADRRWHENADQMARAFSRLNPEYSFRETQRMLYRHLELIKEQVAKRMAGRYSEDVAAFDEYHGQAMDMADFFASGLVRQFPQRF